VLSCLKEINNVDTAEYSARLESSLLRSSFVSASSRSHGAGFGAGGSTSVGSDSFSSGGFSLGIHVPVVDGHRGEVNRLDTVELTNSLARFSGSVKNSHAILEAFNSFLLVNGAFVLVHELSDSVFSAFNIFRVEVSMGMDKFPDCLHGLLHLSRSDLTVFVLNAINMVEDGLGISVFGDTDAREGI